MKWDNKFFRGIGKLLDMYLLSLLWLLFCIPIVTIGASTQAMYYTVHKSIRGNRGYLWESFWTSFKDHIGDNIKLTVIFELIFALLAGDAYIMNVQLEAGSAFGPLYYLFLILIWFAVTWAMWVFAYRARFNQDWKASLKNGLLLSIAHLPTTAVVMLIIFAEIAITDLVWYFLTLVPLLPFLPAGATLAMELIMEKVFRKYMSEEELALEMEYDSENAKN